MRDYFPKVYRSFEDFEREELRRADSLHSSIEDMLDEMFAEELDFEVPSRRRRRDQDEEAQ
ncbi:MAG TPA: hypothetical protein VKN99_08700 [Polyangia bacterium]|nr:hypothetical protein [Polyangia bacterium]